MSYGGTNNSYRISSLGYPVVHNGSQTTYFDATRMANIVSKNQYFKLTYAQNSTVNDFRLGIYNQNGTLDWLVSFNGKIVALANGLIHYKSNNMYDVFIFPGAGYALGQVPESQTSFGSRIQDPAPTVLLEYTPPVSTPIHTVQAPEPPAPVYTSNITAAQSTQVTAARTSQTSIETGNKIYIEEKLGTSGSTVTIDQTGNSVIRGIGGGYAVIEGTNNTFNIKQGSAVGVAGTNLIEFNVKGNSNNVTLWQAKNHLTGADISGDMNNHYALVSITGGSNTVDIRQNSNLLSGHFESLTVTGSSNTLKLVQTDGYEKKFWGAVNGNNNIFDVTQSGAGTKYLDLALAGAGHKATIKQTGAGDHRATISLTNAGGASTLILNQQGANYLNTTNNQLTPQIYSITQSCATAAGCSVSVTQGQ